MNLPNLVFNVHIYCGARSPVTGNPTNVAACAQQEGSLFRRAARTARPWRRTPARWAGLVRVRVRRHEQPPLLTSITAALDVEKVGWAYWAWKYYNDPTGSAAESLVMADGQLRSTALVLSRTYPQAVAGMPISFDFSPTTGVFHLAYMPNHHIRAPTVIFVPPRCTTHVAIAPAPLVPGSRRPGGATNSRCRTPGSGHLVTVVVTPGRCAARPELDPGIGWRHVPQHHDPARARARGHTRGD